MDPAYEDGKYSSAWSRRSLLPTANAVSCAHALKQCGLRMVWNSYTAQEKWHTRKLKRDDALAVSTPLQTTPGGAAYPAPPPSVELRICTNRYELSAEQGQHVLRLRVGDREDAVAGLHEDLCPGQLRRFFGEVRVTDHRFRRGQVLRRDL